MDTVKDYTRQLHFNQKISGINIKITINYTIVGELLSIKSPFWLLPKNARQFTYGDKTNEIEEQLQEFTAYYRFLLPILSLPEEILPGNLTDEDRALAKSIRVEQDALSLKQLRALRTHISDEWTNSLVHRAFYQQTGDFRQKLELIYDLVLLKNSNSYQLIDKLKKQDDDLFIKPLFCGLGRKDLTFRSFASRWLGDHLSETLIPDLVSNLSSPDAWVKTTILGFLEKLKAEEGIEKAIDLLKNDKSPKVQSKSAFYLGEIAAVEAVKSLLFVIGKSDTNWIVKQNALEALGKIGAKEAVKPLLRQLEQSEENEKGDIISALGKHHYDGVAIALTPYLLNQTHCFTTAYALGKLNDKVALPALKAFCQKIAHERRKQRVQQIIDGIEG